jgi:hypothetical protein
MTAKNTAGSHGDHQSGWGVSDLCCEMASNKSMQLMLSVEAVEKPPREEHSQ